MDQNFRAFLKEFEDRFPQEVLTINEELSSIYEPSALVMELDRQKRFPLVYFNKISGSSFRVVSNVIASRKRLAMALGVAPEKAQFHSITGSFLNAPQDALQ